MIVEKMRHLSKEQTQKMIYYGLAVFLFTLPIPQFFMPEKNQAVAMQGTILNLSFLYFGFILFVELINKRITFQDIKSLGLARGCVIGLVIVGVCSILLSEDKMVAIYGTWNRGEGLFSLLAYYMIFWIATTLQDKAYRRRLIYLFLLFGVLISFVGIIQFTGIYQFGKSHQGMASVPMRNPNFYGAFAVLFTGLAIGGFCLYCKESEVTHPYSWWKRPIWFILVLIGYSACISADSSLVYVGLIMLLLLDLFFLVVAKKRDFLSFFCLVAGLLAMIYFFDVIRGETVTEEIMSVANQIEEGGSVFADRVGSSRMMAWKQIVSLLPEYGLFGCGIEQLGPLYIEKFGFYENVYFDKAHNEYLNLWITEGIFAVVLYLVFLFALYIPGMSGLIKNGASSVENKAKDEVAMISLFAFFGYIAQAFFNISVVQVAPYFWMFCGLLYSQKGKVRC